MSPRPDLPPDRGLTHRTLDGMVWLVSSTSAQAVLRLGVVAVLARLLTPYDFGLVAAGLIIVGFTEKGAWLGIHTALVQIPELRPEHVRTGFTLTVLAGIVTGAAVWILSPTISALFRMERLTPLLRGMALVFPLDALSLVSSRLLLRDLHFRRLAGIDLLSYAIGYGAVGIALALAGWGAWALVVALLVQNLVQSAILLAVQPHPVRPQIDRAAMRDLVYLGGGVTLAGIMNYAARNGDNAVVGRWLGATALSVYSRAYTIMNVSNNILSSVLNQVLFSSIAKVQTERDRMAHAYVRASGLMALLFLPAGAATVLLAPEIVDVLLGDQWGGVVVPLQILAVGMLLRNGHKVGAVVARGTGAVYEHAWRQGIYAVLVIAGALVGQRWGVGGVAASTLLALFVNYVLSAELAVRITGLSWRDYATAHLAALPATLLVTVVAWAAVSMLRALDLPSGLTLILDLALVGTISAGLALSSPRLVLGPHGAWFVDRLLHYLPVGSSPARGLQRRLFAKRP